MAAGVVGIREMGILEVEGVGEEGDEIPRPELVRLLRWGEVGGDIGPFVAAGPLDWEERPRDAVTPRPRRTCCTTMPSTRILSAPWWFITWTWSAPTTRYLSTRRPRPRRMKRRS